MPTPFTFYRGYRGIDDPSAIIVKLLNKQIRHKAYSKLQSVKQRRRSETRLGNYSVIAGNSCFALYDKPRAGVMRTIIHLPIIEYLLTNNSQNDLNAVGSIDVMNSLWSAAS
jgi:hypothetical protein